MVWVYNRKSQEESEEKSALLIILEKNQLLEEWMAQIQKDRPCE